MYPRLRERYRITPAEAARFAGTLADAACLVEPLIAEPVVLSDPDDDPVLYTAADGNADILCTFECQTSHRSACPEFLLSAWNSGNDRH